MQPDELVNMLENAIIEKMRQVHGTRMQFFTPSAVVGRRYLGIMDIELDEQFLVEVNVTKAPKTEYDSVGKPLDEKFGTHGRGLLEEKYRELYWRKNELQIIGNEYCIKEAELLQNKMNDIETILNYAPAV